MAGKTKEKHGSLLTAKNPIDGFLNAVNDPILQRRILFHPARNKTGNGCGTRPDGFYLEPLNPQLDCSTSFRPENATVRKTLKQEDPLDAELTEEFAVRRIGAGLANLGNSCFMNSVLQCLTYTQPLAAYFQSGRHKLTCHVAGFCAMCAVQDHTISSLGASSKILSPTFLVRNLRCISRNFRISRQEDAHEYMVNLMEAMHKCCLPAGVTSESPAAYEKSLVHKIFGGRLISQVKCTQCSYCSDKFDPFLDLSLEIIQADSLLKALSHYTAVEQLDGGQKRYKCDRCKVEVKALKQLKIDKAPYILAIHLKRFSTGGSGGKIDKKVDFGCTLDLKPFVNSSHEGNSKYTLYGVLVHAGWSTHSGHYFCFIRASTGIWHALDDSRVYQVSEKSVLSQKAYMLFYIRDKGTSIKPTDGSQSQNNDSKVNKTVPLKMWCPKEIQLQDSCTKMTENLHPNSSIVAIVNKKGKLHKQMGNISNGNFMLASLESKVSAGSSSEAEPVVHHDASLQPASTRNQGFLTNDTFSNHAIANDCKANNSGNIVRQQGTELNRTDAMDNCHGIQVIRHSMTSVMNSENGHWTDKIPKVDAISNGTRHQDANNSRNDLSDTSCGHQTELSRNVSIGKYAAYRHPENGSTTSGFVDNECHNVKHSSLGDGSVFQESRNVALPCNTNGVKTSPLEAIYPDRLSKHIEEAKSVSKQKHPKNLKDSNHLISKKTLKLMKHLEFPQHLRTLPFTRHLLLRAISISWKKRSYERKKCMKLQIKNAGVLFKRKSSTSLVTRKEYAGIKKSGSSVTSKTSPQQSCGKDTSNRKCYRSPVQHDNISETAVGIARNGCTTSKSEQRNADATFPPGSGQISSGNSNGFKRLRQAVDGQGLSKVSCNDSDIEPSDKINKKPLKLVHSKNAMDTFPVGPGLIKEKNLLVLHQSNSSSMNCGDSCQQARALSMENCGTSFLGAKLHGATVPCWNGIEDDWVQSNRAWDKQKINVGYVLDEWDEEYDSGKRKKVKQLQSEDGTDDSDGRHSKGWRNPFQSIANSKAKIRCHKGNTFTRNI